MGDNEKLGLLWVSNSVYDVVLIFRPVNFKVAPYLFVLLAAHTNKQYYKATNER